MVYEEDPAALERERAEMDRIMRGLQDSYTKSLPKRHAGATLATFEAVTPKLAAVRSQCEGWLKDDSRRGLFIYGPVGTGKTHIACALSSALVFRGLRSRFINTAEYLEQRKRSFDGKTTSIEPRDLTCGRDILVIDDLGAERPTDWAREQLFGIIDGAYCADTLVIITSNHTLGELVPSDMLGDRCVSRIVEMCDKLFVDGDDYRKVKGGRR